MNLKTSGKSKNGTKFLVFFSAILICFCFACENSSLKTNGNAAQGAPEQKISEFERDLETMRTANFEYIFVFRRIDGGVIDGEDKTFLKTNLPREINRIIISDEDKAVIAGSHFKFPPENLEILRKRFNIEDYSTKKEDEK